jgi:hypothetical protein
VLIVSSGVLTWWFDVGWLDYVALTSPKAGRMLEGAESALSGAERGNQWASRGSPGAYPVMDSGGGPSTSSPSANLAGALEDV